MIQPENNPENISPSNIFIKIWIAPRAVFRFIEFNGYERHLTLLLMLSGIVRTFNNASIKNMGDLFSLWGVIGFCIVLGALFGWLTYYIYAALVGWTGKWIGGIASTQSILRVLAYAMFPSIVALLLLIPQILVYGNDLFKSDGNILTDNILVNLLFYFSLLAEFGLSMWTIVLCVIGVSEVQRFSIGKAIANLLLPALLFVAVILILFLIYKALA
ncbi:MAG TPA: YIP1 family protein [Flavobacterium sp.]|nr:YIP1 family protein [Flavobacterium sp.]